MQHAEMDQLIERHLAAERAADTAGSVAVYTDDVEHDVVGFPTGPVHGKAAAQGFYEYLVENFQLSPSNLRAVGFGKSRLKNNADPSASENRRVEVVNLAPQAQAQR